MHKEVIRALIPAAGQSKRMHAFKQLLSLGGKTVIETAVNSLLQAGCETASVVTGCQAEAVEQVLSAAFGTRVLFVRNEDYAETDMLYSIQKGLLFLPKCDAFFLLPGDMPFVTPRTFECLLAERLLHPAPILLPAYQGTPVHPPLIDASLIPEICSFSDSGGLRAFFERKKDEIRIVPVSDPESGIDLDTPEDYEQAMNAFVKHIQKE